MWPFRKRCRSKHTVPYTEIYIERYATARCELDLDHSGEHEAEFYWVGVHTWPRRREA